MTSAELAQPSGIFPGYGVRCEGHPYTVISNNQVVTFAYVVRGNSDADWQQPWVAIGRFAGRVNPVL